MPLDQAQAIAALEAAHGNLNQTLDVLNDLAVGVVIPVEHLTSSLDSMSTTVSGTTSAILYSGELAFEHSGEYATAIANADASVAIINKTDAFGLLDSVEFRGALQETVGDVEFNRLINGSTDVNGIRVPDSLWDDISRDFAQNVQGEIRTVTPNADAYRVFTQTELKELLDNDNVTTINGYDKQKYVDYFDDLKNVEGLDEATALNRMNEDLFKGTSIETNFKTDSSFLTKIGGTASDAMDSVVSAAKTLGKYLGPIGTFLGFFVAGAEAKEAHEAGDSLEATEIMTEWGAGEIAGNASFAAGWTLTASATAPANAAGPWGIFGAQALNILGGIAASVIGEEATKAAVDSMFDFGKQAWNWGGDVLNSSVDLFKATFSDGNSVAEYSTISASALAEMLGVGTIESLTGNLNNSWLNTNGYDFGGSEQYLLREGSVVFTDPLGLNQNYMTLGQGGVFFNSETDAITDPANNLFLDFQTDFLKGVSDGTTDNGGLNFLDGLGIDGGNYNGTMPSNILNGDGFFNTVPSGIFTDEWRPGAGELGANDLFLEGLDTTLDNIVDGLKDVGSSFVSGVAGGGLVGGLVTASTSLFTNLVSGAAELLNIDPLVLDLDGDGVELVSFADSIATFDVDNDGYIETTGWVSGDDALLVHDADGDGVINDITETISEYYGAAAGTGALYEDGLAALATLDTNGDNVFDVSDAAYSLLKVWQDANEDARTDSGELKTLAELGISSIDLDRELVSREEIAGNPVLSRSTMMMSGVQHTVAAVDFTTNPVGYEWNDIVGGSTIDLEDGSAKSFIISDQTGDTADFSSLSVDGVIGGAGDDTILGDSGDNWMMGGAGSDTLSGGAGNDLLVIDAEDDVANIDAGDGFDVLQVAGSAAVALNLDDLNAEVAIGGDGGDTIFGGGDTNVFIRGGGGNDAIIGGSADDALSGEDGDDTIDGGRGDDILRGHRGEDLLIGDQGGDLLDGGRDDDRLYGGDGEDLLKGGAGNDQLFGGNDYDVAEFSGKLDEYDVTALGGGKYQVADRVMGRDGTDILTDIEALNFQNIKEIELDLESSLPARDTVQISGPGPYTIAAADILANDLDFQGDTLSITEVLDVQGGTAYIDGNGDVVFTPDANNLGVKSFNYKIQDSSGNTGTIAINSATGESAEMKGKVSLENTDHPDDPLFYEQWYLSDANVIPVWEDYTGRGIDVGVFEVGMMDLDHADLVDNLAQETIDNANPAWIDDHGTLVAGVIGASRNEKGSVGVAYEATLSGRSLEDDVNPNFDVMFDYHDYDIVNNSWGVHSPFADDFDEGNDNIVPFDNAAGLGRNGLGTIVVFGAGNGRADGDSANVYNFYNNKFTIAVGAINKNADLAALEIQQDPFSNPGANILIAAPGSNVTSTSVLLENANGSTFGNSHETAQGTSFATPLVSGVAALMLEANPTLGYRDVQEILAYSASNVNDMNTSWETNGAVNWNGGGLQFSHDYGFGNVDARAAVRLAETWTKQQTFFNESNFVINGNWTNQAIPDNGQISDTVTIGGGNPDLQVEHATVTIDFTHTRVGDLIVKLISPSGMEGILLNRLGVDPDNSSDPGHGAETIEFDFGNVGVWGETAYGNWTLLVEDAKTGETGTINNWTLTLSGKMNDFDDNYIYTEEFSTLSDVSRLTLTDSNGGVDTINASSLLTNTVLNLNDGNSSTLDGQTVTIAVGSIIEKGITGDGDDTLHGNSVNNVLFGGRGNDVMSGAEGNDWLFGAWGDDALTGGANRDRFVVRKGDNGTTTITDFGLSEDVVTLSGYESLEEMADLTIIANGSDTQIDLPDGQTIMMTGVSPATLTNNHFEFVESFTLEEVVLNVYEFTLTENDDYFYAPQDGEGNPILDGTPQRIFGLGGNDTIFGNLGDDELHGGDGNDVLVGHISSEAIDGGEDTLYGDDGDDILYGAGEADILYGGNDNDELYGRRDNDVLYGGRGDDLLVGDEGWDTLHLEYGLNEVIGDKFNADPALLDGTIGRDTYVVHRWTEPVVGSIFGIGLIKDLIWDFDPSLEVIDISDVQGATSFAELGFTTINLNENPYLKIDIGGGQHVALYNVTEAELSASNFVFFENELPVANSDNFTTAEDTPLPFTATELLVNDSDAEDGTPAFSKIVTGPEHGTLTDDGAGNFIYTPEANYNGADTIVYEVVDSHGESVTSLVNIEVTAENDAPVSENPAVLTKKTGQTFYYTLAFDDPDGDLLSYTATQQDGSPLPAWLSFDPATQVLTGMASLVPEVVLLRFTASDGALISSHDMILDIETRAPQAADDEFTGVIDTPIAGNVLADNGNGIDSDPDGDPMTVTAETKATERGGSVTINSDGSFLFTPATGYVGEDRFLYTVSDDQGGSSTALVELTMAATSGDDTITGSTLNDNLDGLDGEDRVSGEEGSDTVIGSGGDDTLFGDYVPEERGDFDQNNVVDGFDFLAWQRGFGGTTDSDDLENWENNFGTPLDGGNDVIEGGDGSNTLHGGNGADTFVFKLATAFNGVDTIVDFDVNSGDAIDIANVLSASYDPMSDLLTDFVQITDDGTDSVLAIDVDGSADNFVSVAILEGVTGVTDEEGLVTSGNLVVV